MVGTGLWGPIWGYVALNEDMKSIYGASFDHKSETPGLGAEIKEPFFEDTFIDKEIYEEQCGKVEFWSTQNFHGFNMSCLYEKALDEKLSQPILDTYDPSKK